MNYMVARRSGVNELDRIFDSFLNDKALPAARVPAVDITESDKGYGIVAELPGFSENELDIQVKENLLTISAQKIEADKDNKDKDEIKILKRERSSHTFKRSFFLPKDASNENIEAVFKDGLLTLSINKKEEAKPQLIKVRAK